VQYFGPEPDPSCTAFDPLRGAWAPCTRDCEVVGYGAPIYSPLDPANPAGGVNVSYYGVVALPSDPYRACPLDPFTGTFGARRITVSLACDPAAGTGVIDGVTEPAPCSYAVAMRSALACGCVPNCYGRNCGGDGCGGFCGGTGTLGACPAGAACTAAGVCCTPDCDGRACNYGALGDGCGGQCGNQSGGCAAGFRCNALQQCVGASASPSPAPLPAVRLAVTNAGDVAATFLGGALSAAVLTLGGAFAARVAAAAKGAGQGGPAGGGAGEE
jgi:hypothetical protein